MKKFRSVLETIGYIIFIFDTMYLGFLCIDLLTANYSGITSDLNGFRWALIIFFVGSIYTMVRLQVQNVAMREQLDESAYGGKSSDTISA